MIEAQVAHPRVDAVVERLLRLLHRCLDSCRADAGSDPALLQPDDRAQLSGVRRRSAFCRLEQRERMVAVRKAVRFLSLD